MREGNIRIPGQKEFKVRETANAKGSKVEACSQGSGTRAEASMSFANIDNRILLLKFLKNFISLFIVLDFENMLRISFQVVTIMQQKPVSSFKPYQ